MDMVIDSIAVSVLSLFCLILNQKQIQMVTVPVTGVVMVLVVM